MGSTPATYVGPWPKQPLAGAAVSRAIPWIGQLQHRLGRTYAFGRQSLPVGGGEEPNRSGLLPATSVGLNPKP